jgi:23S rRNA pseudouridine1911/1915/1917 synthase
VCTWPPEVGRSSANPTYGTKVPAAKASEAAAMFPRQALHSWRVALRQPKTGRELTIEAPLPDDMKQLAAAIGLPS